MTGLTWPARERSSSCSPRRRTPHSSANAIGFLPASKPFEAEGVDDVLAHQLLLAVAGQLEDAAAGREDPAVAVAGDEPAVGGG